MKRILLFLLLTARAFAAYTEFYVQTTGSNVNAGSTTADAALVTGTNGNWNGTTTFVFAGATDLSGVSAGMWGSIYNDGASVAVYVARVATVNDGTDTITFETTAKSGTAPTSSATGRSCKIGGAWAGPATTVGFPFGFPQGTMTDSSANPPRINFLGGTAYAVTATMTHDETGYVLFEGYKAILTSVAAEADDETFTKTAHGLVTGDQVEFTSGTGFTGITAGQNYFVIRATDDTFRLALTHTDAGLGAGISLSADGTSGVMRVAGMAEIDGGATGTAYSVLVFTGLSSEIKHFHFDHNGDAGSAVSGGLDIQAAATVVRRCRFTNMWRAGLRVAGASAVIECEAHSNNVDDAANYGGFLVIEESSLIRCWAHDNGTGGDCEGFVLGSDRGEPVTMVECVAENNGANGLWCSGSHVNLTIIRSNFVNNGESGVDLSSLAVAERSVVVLESCNFVDNGQWGVEYDTTASGFPQLYSCGFYSNTSGETTNVNVSYMTGSRAYTGTPFTDAANGDVSLNNTAGAGASARNAGRGMFLQDSSIYSGTTLSFPSIGAQQPDEPAPGGGGGNGFGGSAN